MPKIKRLESTYIGVYRYHVLIKEYVCRAIKENPVLD
jgi:hypothetical protein